MNAFFPYLTFEEKEHILNQLKNIPLKELQLAFEKKDSKTEVLRPFLNVEKIGSFSTSIGKEAIREGKVGCIVAAGGQGTRLGFKGPKGCFPVMPATKKTLFQSFAEMTKAASVSYQRPLKMAIMTSLDNHEAAYEHFTSHDFFGCSREQISFFQQGELPMLDDKGDLFLNPSKQIAQGADGNGSCIENFFKSGIAASWAKEGIEYVNFILIDNPLADPFDDALISAHIQKKVDVSIKCIQRTNLDEKLGILVESAIGSPKVLEYMEFPRKEWELQDDQENFVYNIGNISLFCFSFSFLNGVYSEKLPLHKAFKKTERLVIKNNQLVTEDAFAWKFEKFIFDLLPFASSSQALLYPREMTFAPLKNSSGDHSLEKVQAALTYRDRKIMESITGTKAPLAVLEISPSFHYPDSNLLSHWKGREIPSVPYVES